MRNFLPLTFIAIVLSSCMKSVSISTLRPAAINIPAEVQTIVLVDRTKFEKDAIGIIEGVLTGEGINEDRDGVMAMFSAMSYNLRNSPRFEIKQEPQRLIGNTITGAFPDPLSWGIVNDICRRHNADAVLAVEVFDSDFIVTNGKRKATKTVEENGRKREMEYTEYFAEGVGNVRIGIRLYNAVSKSIEDQDIYTQNRTWEAAGESLKDALAQMVAKSQATRSLGEAVGATYAGKIAPMPVFLNRAYFAKPKDNQYITRGAREASVDKWDEAISTWKAGIRNTSDTKERGRLAYNIALGYEVLGDFRMAKDWAGRSYVEYGEKKGRAYSAALENRMRQEDLVNQQLSQPEQKSCNQPQNGSASNPLQIKVKDN